MTKSLRDDLDAFSATRARGGTCMVGDLPDAVRDAVEYGISKGMELATLKGWLAERHKFEMSETPLRRHRDRKCACAR